jgi:Tol biopolymer transport system component
MRTLRIVAIVTALVGPSVLLARPQNDSADQQLKAAMHRELVGGDLRAAIKEYEGIVSRHRDNRPVAARALLQIAQCHDKLGQPDARKVYEQIVRDYSDQTEPATQARARLAAMNPQTAAIGLPTPGAARQLQWLDGPKYLLSISPDGTMAAASHYAKGMNLGVFEFAKGRMKSLTDFDWKTSGGVLDVWAAWSSDNQRIAFTRMAVRGDPATELRVTTLTGAVRTLFRSEPGGLVLPADWLPDGRRLLVVIERPDKTLSIGFVPVDGGPFTPLRSLQWPGGYPDRPRVSPDGRFVTFADGSGGARDIYILSVDGRTATVVTDHPAEDHTPVWSPDGRHIAFLSSRFGEEAIWVVPINDGRPTGEPMRVKDGLQGASLKDWRRTGLVYDERTQTSDIYSVALDPTSGTQLDQPKQLPYLRTGRNSSPVWSPDGRFLAFVSGSPAEPNRRYVVVLPDKGGEPREFLMPTTRFSPMGLDPYDLRWFGDGTGLGFSGANAEGQRSVFHLSLATGRWTVLPSPSTSPTFVEWDEHGRRLFYTKDRVSIVERNIDSDEERLVTRVDSQLAIRGLRLSPDRRSLAFILRFSAAVSEAPRLMVTDVQSGNTRTIFNVKRGADENEGAMLGTPAWSPDGRSLLVPHGRANSLPALRVLPVDGGAGRAIALDGAFALTARGSGNYGPLVPITDAVWSPDGGRIFFGLQAFRLTDWIIESVVPPAGSTSRVTR